MVLERPTRTGLIGKQGGMFTLVADKPGGPFRPAVKNYHVLGGGTYFARFFPAPGGLLVNHQSIPRHGRCCFAPMKRAVVDDQGTLRLCWWEGNDKLKGEPIPLRFLPGPGDTATTGTIRFSSQVLLPDKTSSWNY